MRQMPEVLILGVVGLAVNLQRDVVRLCIVDFLLARLDAPLAPWRNDGHVRCKVLDGKLKADLVVALAGAAVHDSVGALLQGNFHKALGDAGPRMAGAQQVVLIDRARLHAGNDEVVDVFLRQVQHIELGSSGLQGFFFQALELIRLPHVAGNCNHFAVVVVLLQPGDDHRGIQPAGICEDDFFDIIFIHDIYSYLYIYA